LDGGQEIAMRLNSRTWHIPHRLLIRLRVLILLVAVAYVPISIVWLAAHPLSWGVFHASVAAVGPIVLGLLAFWRQKDWRFLAIAAGYPVVLYLLHFVQLQLKG
jgi:hypothetical protein